MFLYDGVDGVFELSFIIIICGKLNNVCELDSTHSVLLVKCPRVYAGRRVTPRNSLVSIQNIVTNIYYFFFPWRQ